MSRPVIPSQVGKLLPLLASDKEGEVVATARAICRTLASAKLDLHDLVGALAPAPQPERLKRRRPHTSWQAPHNYDNPDAALVAWCRERGDDWLPYKDREFLATVEPRLWRWGGRLSSAQRAWVEDICAKVEAWEAAA